MDLAKSQAAAFWDKKTYSSDPVKINWWAWPTIIRHINKNVCGDPCDGLHAGFHRLLKNALGNAAKKAVSVGCGVGAKEMDLVQTGLVEHFHLYEISTARIELGIKRAVSLGISDRIHFHNSDALTSCHDHDFDLVYWNNALHHMMDARQAVRWSNDRLKPGGLFAMDDFVGATRFQWTEKSLAIASSFREVLEDRHLLHPTDPKQLLPRKVVRPSLKGMLDEDPSEAADSENIIPAILETFPNSLVRRTGGIIYHLSLSKVLANMDEERDQHLLQAAMVLDDICCQMGESNYAIALANKTSD